MGWRLAKPTAASAATGVVEHRMDGATRVYAAASEMRADGLALAY
ncbi:hypothetical protein AB5I41_03105 [Sphingomonas sp. MMS24-JH45]